MLTLCNAVLQAEISLHLHMVCLGYHLVEWKVFGWRQVGWENVNIMIGNMDPSFNKDSSVLLLLPYIDYSTAY